MSTLLTVDALIGRVYLPPSWCASVSYPGGGSLRFNLREEAVWLAIHATPVYNEDGLITHYVPAMISLTHNERVDAGAALQAVQVFGGSGTPATPSVSSYASVMAVANATLTKAKGDQSLGISTSGVTTNEFTAIGLTRHAVTSPIGGDYAAPSSLGGQFTQNLAYTFTATGSGTAYGAGIFNSTTVAGSILFAEDNFSSTAVMQNQDTLRVSAVVTN